jgi:uncharacterized Fe-S radical SAM superfamily protein PflX
MKLNTAVSWCRRLAQTITLPTNNKLIKERCSSQSNFSNPTCCSSLMATLRTSVQSLHHQHHQQQVRRLHLAPPFLVEDYIPAAVTTYRLGRMPAILRAAQEELQNCNACPRNCGVNRCLLPSYVVDHAEPCTKPSQ